MKNLIKTVAFSALTLLSTTAFAAKDSVVSTLGSSNDGIVLDIEINADMALGDVNISYDGMRLDPAVNGFGDVGHILASISLKKVVNQADLPYDLKITGGMEGMHTDVNGHDVAYLYGASVEFIPFNSADMDITVSAHAFVRDNINLEGATQQIGGVFDAKFVAIGNKFVLNGEVDFIGDEGTKEGFVRAKAFVGIDLIYLFSGHTETGGRVSLGGGFNRNLFNEKDAEAVPYFGIQGAF